MSFTLLVCTLSSQSVNFALSISSLLLKFTKTLDLLFFLISDSFSFDNSLFLLLDTLSVVFNNFLLLQFLLIDFLLLFYLSNSVSCLNLFLDLLVSLFFQLLLFQVFLLSLLNYFDHLLLLFLNGLTFLHPNNLSFFDLINNNSSPASLCFNTRLFFHLSGLKAFESLDLHHEVKFLLFIDPILFKSFIFLELFVSNCNDFGVKNHLVHVFDIVMFLIKLGLGLRKQTLSGLLLSGFNLGWW